MTKPPLFAFFGTPHFSVFVLNALEKRGLLPALIVTAPDRKRGRGLMLSPSPAKAWALERGIDVIEPASLNDEALIAELRNTDWDVFVVAAYAKLIPNTILSIPRRGCLNVHPSLLPKLRGPSPVYSAILENERQTGVSIMEMTEKMDAGPVVAQARIEIAPEDWPIKGSTLLELLATEGGELLAEVMPQWIEGSIQSEPQDESKATYTRKLTDEDAWLDLSGDPEENLRKIRAFNTKDFDSPARAYFIDSQGKRVIVTEATLKEGHLSIQKVIPEGKKEMAFEEYKRNQ